MDYRIISGSDHLNIDEVVRLLKMSYWADKRSVEQMLRLSFRSVSFSVA